MKDTKLIGCFALTEKCNVVLSGLYDNATCVYDDGKIILNTEKLDNTKYWITDGKNSEHTTVYETLDLLKSKC